jgi:hypothetical protein
MNGNNECVRKIFIRKVIALFHNINLPRHLWGEMVKMVCYLRNKFPISVFNGMISLEAAEGEKSDINYLRIIRSLAYVYIPKKTDAKKLDSRTNKGIFVGYTNITRMIRVYDPQKGKITHQRDIIIDKFKRWDDRVREKNEKEDTVTLTFKADDTVNVIFTFSDNLSNT